MNLGVAVLLLFLVSFQSIIAYCRDKETKKWHLMAVDEEEILSSSNQVLIEREEILIVGSNTTKVEEPSQNLLDNEFPFYGTLDNN